MNTVDTATMPPEWYVAFWDGDRPHWWWPICKPGFRHVAAFAFYPDAALWLVYDVTLRRTLIHALAPSQMDAWVAGLPDHRTIIAYTPPVEPEMPAWRFGFWCTPAVAHLVGVATRALRPHALYRDLVLRGARPAFEGEQV